MYYIHVVTLESLHKYMYLCMIMQPLNLMPIVECRVPSSVASRKTLRRRTLQLDAMRDAISGGQSTEQMSAELQVLPKERRTEILREAQLPLEIPASHGLAMKASLQIPWNKMRAVRRYDTGPHVDVEGKLQFS